MKKYIITLLIGIVTVFLFNPTSYALEGIDVSEFQGNIDFKQVKDYGIEVVYIRSSASHSYVDAKFERNYREAKANDLKIGFYHYVTARTVEEAREQARFFASVIAGKEADCLLAMDFEVFTGIRKEEVNAISHAFLETLEELTNKKTIVYSDAYNASRVFDRTISEKYPLWIAEYGVERPEISHWETWTGWQYTDKGRIPGIRGNVDRDIYKDEIFLDDSSAIKEPVVEDKDKTKKIHYRIKKGDTISHIAKKHNTKTEKIIKDNNLKNPDLIFPDQELEIVVDFKYAVTSKGDSTTYIVKRGDTLTRIARIYNVTISNLVTWNNIKNPNLIYPNERIIIKPTNSNHLIKYTIKENETITIIANAYNVSIYELKVVNKDKNINNLKNGDIIFIPEEYIY